MWACCPLLIFKDTMWWVQDCFCHHFVFNIHSLLWGGTVISLLHCCCGDFGWGNEINFSWVFTCLKGSVILIHLISLSSFAKCISNYSGHLLCGFQHRWESQIVETINRRGMLWWVFSFKFVQKQYFSIICLKDFINYFHTR